MQSGDESATAPGRWHPALVERPRRWWNLWINGPGTRRLWEQTAVERLHREAAGASALQSLAVVSAIAERATDRQWRMSPTTTQPLPGHFRRPFQQPMPAQFQRPFQPRFRWQFRVVERDGDTESESFVSAWLP